LIDFSRSKPVCWFPTVSRLAGALSRLAYGGIDFYYPLAGSLKGDDFEARLGARRLFSAPLAAEEWCHPTHTARGPAISDRRREGK
jgi:hypothetical protein